MELHIKAVTTQHLAHCGNLPSTQRLWQEEQDPKSLRDTSLGEGLGCGSLVVYST